MLLALVAAAHALTCKEVTNMLDLSVPSEIVEQLVRSREPLSDADLECLKQAGAPPEVLAAAHVRRAGAETEARIVAERRGAPGGSPMLSSPEGDGPDLVRWTPDGARASDLTDANAARLVTNGPRGEPSALVYALAQKLDAADLPISATHWYAVLTTRGPADPYLSQALIRLEKLAPRTGDWSAIDALAGTLTPEEYPACCVNVLSYRAGLLALEADKLDEARAAFERVASSSPHWTRAKLAGGTVHARQRKLKSAIRAFTDVVRTEVSVPTKEELAAVDRVRDLAVLDIGRVYYGLGQWEHAKTYYGTVPTKGRYGPIAAFEGAWAAFMNKDPATADKYLGAVPREAWMPEAALLRGILAFQAGRYDEADAQAARIHSLVDPVRDELAEILPRKLPANVLIKRWDAQGSPIPGPLLEKWGWDTGLSHARRVLAGLRAEEEALGKGAWRPLADGLRTRLAAAKVAAEGRAAARLTVLATRERAYLDDLALQADLLAFEAARARAGTTPDLVQRGEALLLRLHGDHAAELELLLTEMRDEPPVQHIARYEAFLSKYPASVPASEVRVRLGDLRFLRKEFAEARAAYTPVADTAGDPLQPYAAYKRAWTSWGLGDKALAISQLEALLSNAATPADLRAAATMELAKMRAAR